MLRYVFYYFSGGRGPKSLVFLMFFRVLIWTIGFLFFAMQVYCCVALFHVGVSYLALAFISPILLLVWYAVVFGVRRMAVPELIIL